MAKLVPKAWGTEEWMCNTSLYCLKRLLVNPGWTCSTHAHAVKDETFVCEAGHGFVWVEGEIHEMLPGAAVRIKPGTWHYFFCPHSEKGPLELLEASTHHSDDDVMRVARFHSRELPRPMQEEPEEDNNEQGGGVPGL